MIKHRLEENISMQIAVYKLYHRKKFLNVNKHWQFKATIIVKSCWVIKTQQEMHKQKMYSNLSS